MEFDAIARFLQDAGNDDTDDANLEELGLAWVARRGVIRVGASAKPRELLDISTWCSGVGRRWAERRTSMRGEWGASVDAAVVWVHVDTTTGRPAQWGQDFASTYLEATQGRAVDAKLRHPKLPRDDATTERWSFRRTDHDAFGHVNNAAYLAVAEEFASDVLAGEATVEIEWRSPSWSHEDLTVHVSQPGDGQVLIHLTPDGTTDVRATLRVIGGSDRGLSEGHRFEPM